MGYLKYGLVFLLSAWMFFLGILVGRGTAPVSLDTQRLKHRLATIAEDCSQRLKSISKPDLVFYDVLKKPARTGDAGPEVKGEILPVRKGERKITQASDGVRAAEAVKKSLKEESFQIRQEASENGNGKGERDIRPSPDVSVPAELTRTEDSAKALVATGNYTIQVASFKALQDAAVQMDALEKKGYAAYKTMGKVGDSIWVRVRTGEFKTRGEATEQLKKLEADGIKGLIIKKD